MLNKKFLDRIKDNGFNFATGVPCGVLKYIIAGFAHDKQFSHFPALNEREAIGISAGAWLAGKNPVVYMQNSGMFVASNDIASLLIPCQIPILMIVSYRGCPGENAEQHLITGDATKPLLDAFHIPYIELEEYNIDKVKKIKNPSVILIKRGWTSLVESQKQITEKEKKNIEAKSGERGIVHDERGDGKELGRESALGLIEKVAEGNMAVISSTGLISRSLYERHDSPNKFYNTGGFGLTSSIGFGFAVSRPEIKTIVVEGDASMLTNFGNIITIGHSAPKNFVHIIIDNQAYGSCSEEKSISSSVNLADFTVNNGYKHAFLANSASGFERSLKSALKIEGPILIHVKIKLGGRRDFARPVSMSEVARRFRNNFK